MRCSKSFNKWNTRPSNADLACTQAQAEAFTLAESAGIPRETAYDLISGPTGLFNRCVCTVSSARPAHHVDREAGSFNPLFSKQVMPAA